MKALGLIHDSACGVAAFIGILTGARRSGGLRPFAGLDFPSRARGISSEICVRDRDRQGRLRAGMALVARGEFSIVIAGLGAGLEPRLGPLSAAYVLFLAMLGPILMRAAK